MKKQKTVTTGKQWLNKETRPYNRSVFFLTVLTIISTVFSLAFAYMVRYLINSASAGEEKKLWIFSLVLLGLLLIRILIKTVTSFFAEKLRAKIVAILRTKIFSKILRSDYASVQGYHSGEMLTRLTADVQEIAADTVGLLPTIVGMAVQALGAVFALLTIDPLFTAVYVVCGGAFGGLTALFRKQIKRKHKEVLIADEKFRSFMQEGLSSIMTLKAYGAENRTEKKAETFAKVYYEKRMKQNVLRACMNCVFSFLSNFGLIFAVVWCSISVLNGNTDYGSILSVILLLMQLQQPLSGFSSVIPVYYSRMASAERLAELENIPCEDLAEREEADLELYNQLQAFEFEKVSFSYGRESVLVDVNATLQKGKIVCLTGASGGGKSTLFKLLLNVFTPTDGKICITGEFGERLLTAKERGLFAYVPQGNFLFSGTIRENLAFFSEEKNEEALNDKIKHAIHTACADFVWELPQGLNTVLSERGEGLSEGQLQRLAIARALLSERPVLLLDEATSALDGETEQMLLANIRALENKTCLIVTHRPAALDIADGILSVENGMVVVKK